MPDRPTFERSLAVQHAADVAALHMRLHPAFANVPADVADLTGESTIPGLFMSEEPLERRASERSPMRRTIDEQLFDLEFRAESSAEPLRSTDLLLMALLREVRLLRTDLLAARLI
jgi:hypothetical protein